MENAASTAGSVSMDVAIQEVDKWLDTKKVRTSKREQLKPQIETMVDMVASGNLSIGEDGKMKYRLVFPTENLVELDIKSRVTPNQIKPWLKNVKAGDSDARLMAYCSAITGQISGVISGLDTEDYGVLCDITSFFF